MNAVTSRSRDGSIDAIGTLLARYGCRPGHVFAAARRLLESCDDASLVAAVIESRGSEGRELTVDLVLDDVRDASRRISAIGRR